MNMKMYFVSLAYVDGDASIIRLIGYAKSASELGIDTHLCFLIPDKNRNKIDRKSLPKDLMIHYLWDNCKGSKYKIFAKSIIKLGKLIPNDAWVFSYFNSRMFWILKGIRSHKVYEITEHPFYSGDTSLSKSMNVWFKFMLSRKSKFAVISTSLKRYLTTRGIHENNISIINMFVDASRFDGIKEEKKKIISYCGSVSYNKDGADILIKAFKEVYKKHPDYLLRIIGKGIQSDTIEKLKLLTNSLGISESVVFTGAVPSEMIPHLLKESRILALARPDNVQARNGFPTKLGEYLVSGNPVAVTSVGDIPLFIEDKVNGVLANPGDVESFANALNWIIEHPNESKIIGINGKELAEKHFLAKTETLKLLKFLKDG